MVRGRFVPKAAIGVLLATVVAGSSFAIVVPASAQDPGCVPQPTPYNVNMSVTPAQVEVGEDVGMSVTVTDATGAPVDCGTVGIRVSGGGTVPTRTAARVQDGSSEAYLFFLPIVLGSNEAHIEVPVQEPGNYQLEACVEHPEGGASCSTPGALAAKCDVYGTMGNDSISMFAPEIRANLTTSVCLLDGDDEFFLQDDLDAAQRDPLNISMGNGNDFFSPQHVTGQGPDNRPFPYVLYGGSGNDQTGRSLTDLQLFSGYLPVELFMDWHYPGVWPVTARPGDDIARGPILGALIEGGPGSDRLEGGANGPNKMYGHYSFINVQEHGVNPADRTFFQYGYFDMPDQDTITGGNHNDVVEGGFDIDIIELLGGRDEAVGDIWILPTRTIPDLVGVLFGGDNINAGSNPSTAKPESVFGDIAAGGVFVGRVPAGFQGDVPAVDGGDDTLIGEGGRQRLNGQSGNDKLTGGGGNDNLIGGAGNDVLKGSAGSDVLTAGAGRDVLDGGKGDDRCAGGPGADRQTSC